MTLGLVLGGGGVVGIAWEIGVLAGLADALGWNPNSAAAIVGTSAGAVNGTQLRRGRSLDQMVGEQRQGDDPLLRGGGAVPADGDATMEVFRLWASVEQMDPATARRVAELAGRATERPEEDWVGNFEAILGSSDWPEGDLRVTGVSVSTGERVLWTASSGVPLVNAVAASCAVPGLFPPVTVGGDRYVDGGLWSTSNADVLAGEPYDAVIYIGPMGVAATGLGRLSARTLEAERKLLADAGIECHAVEPGDRFTGAAMQLVDASRRVEALEIGLAEGKDAAKEVASILKAA